MAAKRFLAKALSGLKEWEQPELINTDKAPTYAAALAALKAEGKCPKDTQHRQIKYLNNIIEADHGKLKQLIRPVRGFKSMKTAYATIKGFEVMRALRKGQAAIFTLTCDIVGEARLVERAFGLGPCALTEAIQRSGRVSASTTSRKSITPLQPEVCNRALWKRCAPLRGHSALHTVYACHCTDCQRMTSSSFSMAIVLPAAAFHLDAGEPRLSERGADGGRVTTRWVCPECDRGSAWVQFRARQVAMCEPAP